MRDNVLMIKASTLDAALAIAYEQLSKTYTNETVRVQFRSVEFVAGCLLTPFTYIFDVFTIGEGR